MSGIYVVEMLDVLVDAGCRVAENGTTNGWQSRARSSGGFPSTPLGIQWHHTASSTSPANDLSWMIDGSDDAPIGNLLLDRDGVFWPVAAGASNTAGKGGPLTLSRGTIPVDSANTRSFAFEVANSGTGQTWPVAQIDAYFAGSNALNAHFGNLPTDVFTHALGAGNGWTDRKVDPATAVAVEGPWKPRSCTSSGTWSLDDIRAECARRATPTPPPPEEHDMTTPATVYLGDDLHVFTRGGDAQLWHQWYSNGRWHSECLGGQIASSPSAAVHTPSGRVDVAAQGTDRALWQLWYDGARWSPWVKLSEWAGTEEGNDHDR